jgi:hypothetical protein
MDRELKNQRIPDDVFMKERAEVLQQWPTGKEVDFKEAVEYQLSIDKSKRFGEKLAKADKEGITLVQPRAGVALYQEHILVVSIAAALLLISPIRMFALKFKGFGWRGNEVRYAFLLVSLALIIIVPAYSILAIIVLYIAISTLRWVVVGRKTETEK